MRNKMAERLARLEGERGARKRRHTSDKMLRKVSELTVNVKGEDVTFDIEEEVSIDGEPSEVLSTHVKRFLFWKRLLVAASKVRRDLEFGNEEYAERLRFAYRIRLERDAENARSSKRVTEKMIESEVRTDPDYAQRVAKMHAAIETEETCRMMVDAFEHRKVVLMKAWKADVV